ncbi:MAG: hypothetical protein AAFP09_05130 [Cyanobacteria bacterium J06607_10]
MKIIKSPSLLITMLLTILLVGCSTDGKVQTVPAVTQSQFLAPPDDLRDVRYCEVIPAFRRGTMLTLEVYNTLGLNDCPADLWNALDEQDLSATYDAQAIKLNGPRYWVVNDIAARGTTATGGIADFGGIEMKFVATIDISIREARRLDAAPYAETEVQRTTTFLYRAGNQVYELLSPEGDIYRMQSYSQIVNPALAIADLETLTSQLNLPEGWQYQTRTLTEDTELIADGLAYVITDDLLNTYQKVTP